MGEVISLMDRSRVVTPAPAVEPDSDSNLPDPNWTFRDDKGTEFINFKFMLTSAMLGLVRDTLMMVAEEGLPGGSRLFITLYSTAPGVEMPDWLREKHPQTLTIMLDRWWQDLIVEDDRFSVVLNFSNVAAQIVVPFEAIYTFVDPGTEFGIRFEE